MTQSFFFTLLSLAMLALTSASTTAADAATAASNSESKQFYEIRTYLLGDNGDFEAVDQYLGQALVPALQRQDVGPVGVFTPAENDTLDQARVIVVIPLKSAGDLVKVHQAVQADATYQSAAKPYLDRGPENPPFERISSELLVAMDCMPELNVPQGALDNPDRVYELRLYESANERLGGLKVDMFNNGEVPIFLKSGITPILIGQAVVGPQTPNLTYLTVYENDEARRKAWDTFRAHPDWQVLKAVEKYQGTVSKIDLHILQARPYSQL
ncbi:NIPSNAP family protein [Stieleria sp. TO1_6]|uniref:NIPSNAP family protein n=1 Tax=Stieleria tagensis TaxID=2956795 RepID=UPI00209A64DC|nr:NIPSNAP family protein [Stieleria tagensis]MCO8122783.1 NIPSNAP family protein [Stieleria tagensis]